MKFSFQSFARSKGKSAFIQRESGVQQHSVRLRWVLGFLMVAAAALAARAVDLQLMDNEFLEKQGDARHLRVVPISAHRGTITDRYGEPLAVSTPVESVWVNPKEFSRSPGQLPRLARALRRDPQTLARRLSSNVERDFLFLARHLSPTEAARVRALNIPKVYMEREYRRFYPGGEVTGQMLGFTNIDDKGQEGLELAYEHWLAGQDGSKRVLQDNHKRVIQDVESIREVRPGKDLVLSLDLRIQYLAYRELKRALLENRAGAGSLVVLDIPTGEVLAMVTQPAFNSNDLKQRSFHLYRNRGATDIFEPGSSIKPFVLAAALASGRFTADSVIDTDPGQMRVANITVRDKHNNGPIDLTTVLARSSNVGMAKVALKLEPERMWNMLDGLGFGQMTGAGFPSESAGLLTHYSHWRQVAIATLSYGYGMSVTTLQLARAYAALGSGGVLRPVTFVRSDAGGDGAPEERHDVRVMDEGVAKSMVHMMEAVVTADGTGSLAGISGYRVAGKTGTAWKATAGGYSRDKYMAVFAGVAPATRPRLAAVVVIDEPTAGKFYGGDVAAPVFAAVLSGALRLMAVQPDAVVPDEAAPLREAAVQEQP